MPGVDPVGVGVVGAPHLAHAAAAQQLDQAVARYQDNSGRLATPIGPRKSLGRTLSTTRTPCAVPDDIAVPSGFSPSHPDSRRPGQPALNRRLI
jgi:hypothetical protein